jgi:branched-chain amino acid aminotransferase
MADNPDAAGGHPSTTAPTLWIDGSLQPVSEARVSPLDHGFTVGDGVFETCKVVGGRAFALTRHLRRLRSSAEGLGLDPGVDDAVLRDALDAVLVANRLETGRVRITVSGGVGPLGSDRTSAPATVVVACSPTAPTPAVAHVATVRWPRNERSAVAGLKTTSYAENVVALAEARRRGADEAVVANTAGRLCEGTGSNVFLVVDGAPVTPSLASGCLAGVTRALVLEAVPEIEELDVPLHALADASEAFLTSSTRDVQPIGTVDGSPLPTCPGPWTQRAAAALAALEARDLDP